MRRFKHSLSNYRLLTGDMGQLLPVGVTEVLPGDSIQHRTSALIRVSPLVAPVMHPVQVRIHHFFVPNRILWSGWEDFITGGPDGLGSSEQFPTITLGASTSKELSDYLGVPPVAGLEVSALPFRAYNLIYNEFYRDQDLVQEVSLDENKLKNVAWEKDYFAVSRPWTQKGPDVSLPIGGQAPVYVDGTTGGSYNVKDSGNADRGFDSTGNQVLVGASAGNADLYADLSQATAANVNDYRLAFALQRYQEARARYGSRFTEYLRYLGVRPSDARLQRPEYLGGGKQTISFSEVLQTAPDATSGTVVGDLTGHGIAAMRANRYRKFFEEHGHVISLMSVRPKTIYSAALHKKWLRRTKEDYWQKELETIGQQAITNAEIYPQNTADDALTFGHADRYREYREEPSLVSGEFRDTLDYWHMARQFSSLPVLNQAFTDCVPTKRIHAEQTQNSLWCMINHSIQARRLVSKSAHSRIV